MKSFRTSEGPYSKRLLYETQEIDTICEDALRKTGLLPGEPAAIKIDRFLEKFFQVPVLYEDMGPGLLGCTIFGRGGEVTGFIISPTVEADGTKSSERRARSTLAHEGGHGLLHPLLFMNEDGTGSLFGVEEEEQPRILCRGDDISAAKAKPYNGRWWEWQANRAIAGLLLPKKLVTKAIASFLDGAKMIPAFEENQREIAVREVAALFDVNPAVARIRLEEMYPRSGQITL